MPQTTPDQPGPPPTDRGSTSTALLAALAAVGLLIIAGIAVLLATGNDEPMPPMGEALVVAAEEASDRGEDGTGGTDGDAAGSDGAAPDAGEDAAGSPSSVTAPDSSDDTATRQTGRCSSGGYSIEIPDGWATPDCRNFSPGDIEPGADIRAEIDLFWAERETYDEALARIAATLDVVAEQEVTVADRPATRFQVTEVDGGDQGSRLVVVVDAGSGVFFASANELVSGTGAIADRAAHFEQTRQALASMIDSAEF
ncbi:MAG: hypothetical protein AAF962_14055 [Actinomycetota bacterium]